MQKLKIPYSKYTIRKGKIVNAKNLTKAEKFFEIELENGDFLNHEPGQFVQVSIFGVGEAPISLCSSPTQRETFELAVRNVGKFTNALHQLGKGDTVGIRGPFGKGFPVIALEGKNLLFVAGGIGIVPMRSLINYVIENRRDFGNVQILLGCKTPQDLLFGDEIDYWKERVDVNFGCTVDKADPDWKGNVGLITSLIPGLNLEPDKTIALVVGPPVMYPHVIKELIDKNIPEHQILLSLERHMKCGVGKCGHCQIYDIYTCQEGPVFRYDKVKHLKGAI